MEVWRRKKLSSHVVEFGEINLDNCVAVVVAQTAIESRRAVGSAADRLSAH